MTRLLRILAVATLVVGSMTVGRLAFPTGAFACVCADIPAIDTFDGLDEAVVVGRVGVANAEGQFPLSVERWLHGGDAANVLVTSEFTRFPDGSWVINSCGATMEAGDHLILGAGTAGGLLSPSACTPLAEVESPEGRAMLASAERRFGPGRIPGAAPAIDADPASDLGLVGAAVVIALVAIVVVIAALAIGRRGPPETGAA